MIIAAKNLSWILDKPEYGYLASDVIVCITISNPMNTDNRSETGPLPYSVACQAQWPIHPELPQGKVITYSDVS